MRARGHDASPAIVAQVAHARPLARGASTCASIVARRRAKSFATRRTRSRDAHLSEASRSAEWIVASRESDAHRFPKSSRDVRPRRDEVIVVSSVCVAPGARGRHIPFHRFVCSRRYPIRQRRDCDRSRCSMVPCTRVRSLNVSRVRGTRCMRPSRRMSLSDEAFASPCDCGRHLARAKDACEHGVLHRKSDVRSRPPWVAVESTCTTIAVAMAARKVWMRR